ncbi:cytochrome P450 [Actinoallomurus purpureus]|uniref:cytochrome P450 family protein n=1 Tax=Actinoallomurus purpureus TaxID=478114 RepID=UPI002092C8B4|nr:cytochrome P450 [Actinoallomurus purpureus]MCO6005753.1 cytochrome P450 [Actinoallomurus purpureus]
MADPFPFYRRLREGGPVRRVVTVRGMEAWLVTRYGDAREALTDPRLTSDLRGATDPRLLEQLPSAERTSAMRSMVRLDAPDHGRLRRLVSKAFTARRVAELEPRVQAITDRLLDAIIPAGRADLIKDFALPLPVTVISELLGVPLTDRDRFQEWTNVLLTQRPDRPDLAATERAWRQMWSYLEGLLAAKRTDPADDLLGALITARDRDQRLDEGELVAMAFLLLVAGYITTVNLIGNGIVALLAHPAQLKLLRDDPGLLPGAVEEFLRYDGPVNPGILRVAAENLEIGGVAVPRGATVIIATAVADRDLTEFPEADRLDVTRTAGAHLAFGHGIHYCLGAPLARLEGRIAIGTALRRLDDLALAVPYEELPWQVAGLRGLEHLPVTFTPVNC